MFRRYDSTTRPLLQVDIPTPFGGGCLSANATPSLAGISTNGITLQGESNGDNPQTFTFLSPDVTLAGIDGSSFAINMFALLLWPFGGAGVSPSFNLGSC